MFGSSNSSSSSSSSDNGATLQDAQQLLSFMVLSVLNEQVQKTCFEKCISGAKFGDELSKGDQVCLAKCMDRMYESHAIVARAANEMAQNLQQSSSNNL
ncbi:hypothetical protein, conserved [Eimeria acervulina]|uniref:Mitochondrial import inner membrane translocase subunit n=1 Tax=Eimeria acervulina TaxID=5801 RepID=U6GE11_EIMAC|nr:hypothetical protein, conserved [Eimeria acervulina]CDI77777.1 hypothetical protein, conserved [Eimeria acervulina]